jgi:hypothetical protein
MFDEKYSITFPATLAETNTLIAEVAGSITSLKFALSEHFRKDAAGVEVDWDWHHRAKTKLSHLIHAQRGLHVNKKALQERAHLEAKERYAERKVVIQGKQLAIEKQAQDAKTARLQDKHRRHARRMEAGRAAAVRFVLQRGPEHKEELQHAIAVAEEATIR